MKKNRQRLNVINDNTIVKNTTCFSIQAKHNIDCQRKNCQHWIEHSECNNCVLIAAQTGNYTLQKIGQIYKLTRMRICQIEKNIFQKIKNTN